MDTEVDRGSFGPVLRRLRRAAGMSQEDLAERARLSVESISALERGKRRAPYRETIRMIGDALRLSDADRRELEAAAKRVRVGLANTASYDSGDPGAAAGAFPQAPDHMRRSLTRPLSTFLGRRRELADIAALVEQHRLVSIVGAGGIGKTRTAVELAWTGLGPYRDGIWFVDLAPLTDQSAVAPSLVATLGTPQAEGQDATQALTDQLRQRVALLVIDNCEHVVQQVAKLAHALLGACPTLRMLVTSREPLHVPGERVYRLPPLEWPSGAAARSAEKSLEFSAVALFVERSKAADEAFRFNDVQASTVAQLCRRLDGIALAIELAASRTAVLTPSQILEQLNNQFRILTGGSRTALPRQQTMRETIRWSYDRLDEREQTLFRRAAAFANGFTSDSISALSHVMPDPFVALDVLSSLVDKSLVLAQASPTKVRFRLLEPIRDFGLEMLAGAGERDDADQCVARWCAQFVRTAHAAWETASSAAWFADVEPEMDNLRATLGWAIDDRNDVELGLQIVGDSRRLWARLFPAEGKRWVAEARRLVSDDTPASVRAALVLADAHLHTALQQYDTALAAATAYMDLYASDSNTIDVAEARFFAGNALEGVGRSEDGERLIAMSIDVYRAQGAKQLAAHGINSLGIIHSNRGDLEAARRLFAEALGLFREVGNERGVSSVAANLAETEFRAGNAQAAIRSCQDALAASGSGREARIYLANLAAYLVEVGDYDAARANARESILARENSFGGGIPRADVGVAFALQHLAAVAGLRPEHPTRNPENELSRAAGLLGFVDARLAEFKTVRQYTEQHECDVLAQTLRSKLGAASFDMLCARGREWTEDDAVREALLI